MISLHQLRTFVEVARHGSVGETADALVISQPAVSAALASLQRAVGVRLTERDGRKMRLTRAGESFAVYGRRIFALLEEAQREARERADATTSRVAIAAVTTAAEHMVPDLLRKFRAARAQTNVELDVGNHVRVWDRLRHWEVDLVIAGRPPHDGPFTTLATRAHEMIVIGPGGAAGAETLAAATWLVREDGSGTRATTEEFFAALGIDPARISIASNGAIGACVQAGLGYSLVSRDGIERELRSGLVQCVPAPGTPLQREWHLAAANDRPLREAVRDVVAFAVASCGFTART